MSDIDNIDDYYRIIVFYCLHCLIVLDILLKPYHYFRRFQTPTRVSKSVLGQFRAITLRGFPVLSNQISKNAWIKPPSCFVHPCTISSVLGFLGHYLHIQYLQYWNTRCWKRQNYTLNGNKNSVHHLNLIIVTVYLSVYELNILIKTNPFSEPLVFVDLISMFDRYFTILWCFFINHAVIIWAS